MTEKLTMRRGLQKLSFQECNHPYGKIVKALLIVEGWHVRYLAALVGFSVVVSLCVVAIVTLVKDIAIGIAVGSYTIGGAAVLLGLLTVLSSIL